MADGAYGAREIVLDLTVAGARVIRASPLLSHIIGIKVQGTAGAGAGDIVLRQDSATGPIIFQLAVDAGGSADGAVIPMDTWAVGLYCDAPAVVWAARSTCIIYTK